MESENRFVPRTLDNPPRFAIWDIYQASIFLIFFSLGVIFHMIFFGLVIAIIAAKVYRKISSGQSRGFLVHLLYWFTTLGDGYKSIPPSNKRYFQG